MMIVTKGFQMEIKFCEERFCTLVIENKALYRDILYSFHTDTPDEYFIFSEDYVPFAFAKKGIYIADAVNPDLENKKLTAKITAMLESIANESYYMELAKLKGCLTGFADALASCVDFELEYNWEIDTKALIKLFNFRMEKGEDGFAEILLRYIQLLHRYLGTSLFVITNLHHVFEEEELDFMFQTLAFEEVHLLCIENSIPHNLSSREKVYIIDKDLCEIE